ncbi:sugar phosphate nucleotidyltransferase, partial [Treponema sp. R6D11]
MKAIIMAGGEGTRLRPLTSTRPKPMVNFMGKPMLEHIIDLLKKHGINEIYITLAYMPEKIMDYFGDGREFGVQIKYFTEEIPLGTAGSVKQAASGLNEDFLVISGDCLTDCNLTELITFHKNRQAVATISLSRSAEPLEYGVVVADENNKITRLLEKPDWVDVISDSINTGIYVLNTAIFQEFENKQNFDFSKDVFPRLIEADAPIYAMHQDNYWCDIGDLKTYMQATKDVFAGKIRLDIAPSENVRVADSAEIARNVYIGNNVTIGEGAHIGADSIIEDDVIISAYASIKESYIHKRCKIGKGSQLRASIISEGAILGERVSCFEGSVVGDESNLGDLSEVYADIKIWPKKTIERNSIVSSNLVFASNISHSIFDGAAVSGTVNVDITPEFATKLGSTFGAVIKEGKIGVSYGSGGAVLMLKDALIAGLLSSGAEVHDFSVGTLATSRAAVDFFGLDGGIYLYFNEEKQKLSINFLSRHGINLSRDEERKLEQLFMREDFSREQAVGIKNIVKFQDYNRFYLQNLHNFMGGVELGIPITVISKAETSGNIAKTMLEGVGVRVLDKKELGVLAFYVDDLGENVIIHDEAGRKVSNEAIWALFVSILASRGVKKVVLPITLPDFIRKFADS